MKAFIQLFAVLAIAVAVSQSPALATDDTADAPMLRKSVYVRGDVVRLGDLFINAGPKAETPVAYAPQPGKRAVFDATWLYKVARAYGLSWRPNTKRTQIVVQRQAHVVGREEVADTILAALLDRGADWGIDTDMQVSISNRSLKLYVADDLAATVGIEDINYDVRTKRFAAIVTAPANDPAAQRVRVVGKVYRTMDVPVLSRRLVRGETIRRGDIKMISMHADKVRGDVIVDVEDLIGRTPKRGSLREGMPLRFSQVQRPLLVKKGALVTMTMQAANMTLTAKGKALDKGADGDTIRVSNLQSKTVVETVVTGTNKVAVVPLTRVALAN